MMTINNLYKINIRLRTSCKFHDIQRSMSVLNDVVFIDGARTPFCKSSTCLGEMKPHQLAASAIKGLVERVGINKKHIDYVAMGTVVQEVTTSNVARDSMLVAGIPNHVSAHTVSMACISANQAITTSVNMIKLSQADVVIAGGVDSLSDPPIKISKSLRQLVAKLKMAKNTNDYKSAISTLTIKDIGIDIPSIAEYTSNETMGHSADRLCSSFEISRQQQDEYALRSFKAAEKAKRDNHLCDIVPVMTDSGIIKHDNTIRTLTMEKLGAMRPVFIKDYGTVTAGNSSPLTDGASVSLIMSKNKAAELKLQPKAYIRDFIYTAQDPINQLLIGPAYSISKLMLRNQLTWNDISVVELHEAFAGQVLAVSAALGSDYFCKNHIGLEHSFGAIPMDKLNNWGGSISLGHPFGATGSRILTMAANRLIYEHSIDANSPRYSIISACAAGGLSHAMLIERYP